MTQFDPVLQQLPQGTRTAMEGAHPWAKRVPALSTSRLNWDWAPWGGIFSPGKDLDNLGFRLRKPPIGAETNAGSQANISSARGIHGDKAWHGNIGTPTARYFAGKWLSYNSYACVVVCVVHLVVVNAFWLNVYCRCCYCRPLWCWLEGKTRDRKKCTTKRQAHRKRTNRHRFKMIRKSSEQGWKKKRNKQNKLEWYK